MNSIFILP